MFLLFDQQTIFFIFSKILLLDYFDFLLIVGFAPLFCGVVTHHGVVHFLSVQLIELIEEVSLGEIVVLNYFVLDFLELGGLLLLFLLGLLLWLLLELLRLFL